MDIQYLRWWTNERVSRELKKKKNSRSAAYEVLANIQRLKGGCCLESGRFRGFKKEGGAPRSIFAYELRATSDIFRNFFPCEYILWPY